MSSLHILDTGGLYIFFEKNQIHKLTFLIRQVDDGYVVCILSGNYNQMIIEFPKFWKALEVIRKVGFNYLLIL